ncbi:MAG TPA: BLUF domain-containing protein [Acetobacteraceae bacterium]
MMRFHRLLYQSESLITGTETDVRGQVTSIVAAARHRNERDGLTGALLFVDGLFIQALEGNVGKLEATFERICRDLRHRRVVLHDFSEAQERVFAGWAMVEVPGTGNADGLFTSAAGDPPRAGRNTTLARAALALLRDRLSGSAPTAGRAGSDGVRTV